MKVKYVISVLMVKVSCLMLKLHWFREYSLDCFLFASLFHFSEHSIDESAPLCKNLRNNYSLFSSLLILLHFFRAKYEYDEELLYALSWNSNFSVCWVVVVGVGGGRLACSILTLDVDHCDTQFSFILLFSYFIPWQYFLQLSLCFLAFVSFSTPLC